MTGQSLRPAERLFVAVQHLLPQHLLSALMYRVARWRWRPFKDALIGWFVRHFRVDMSLAAEIDPRAYPSFNAFFTRAYLHFIRNDAFAGFFQLCHLFLLKKLISPEPNTLTEPMPLPGLTEYFIAFVTIILARFAASDTLKP